LGVRCLTTNHLANEWLDCRVDPASPTWKKLALQLVSLFTRSQVYRRLRFEVCVSKHDQARVIRMFPLFRRKILQIYHSLLSAAADPPRLTSRDPAVLCVGTIGGRKAQPILAEAFARVASKHKEWRLDLVGRTGFEEDAKRIQDIAGRAGLADRINL